MSEHAWYNDIFLFMDMISGKTSTTSAFNQIYAAFITKDEQFLKNQIKKGYIVSRDVCQMFLSICKSHALYRNDSLKSLYNNAKIFPYIFHKSVVNKDFSFTDSREMYSYNNRDIDVRHTLKSICSPDSIFDKMYLCGKDVTVKKYMLQIALNDASYTSYILDFIMTYNSQVSRESTIVNKNIVIDVNGTIFQSGELDNNSISIKMGDIDVSKENVYIKLYATKKVKSIETPNFLYASYIHVIHRANKHIITWIQVDELDIEHEYIELFDTLSVLSDKKDIHGYLK